MSTLEHINLIQRSTAIVAVGLLTLHLFIINFNKLEKIKSLNLFILYCLVFIQPILIILGRYIFNSDFDPFYMYTDLCALCGGKGEYMINFLRIAFYSISLAVFAPIFKNMDKWLKNNYNIFEYLYFVGFYSLSIYLYNTGPIIRPKLFVIFFWVCQVVVIVVIARLFFKNKWSSSFLRRT